jgi:hypothetical protein
MVNEITDSFQCVRQYEGDRSKGMLFFFVVPFWAMAFFLGLILLVFPTQRFAASYLLLISTCAAVGSIAASVGLTLVFGLALHARSMEVIAAAALIAGIMLGGFHGGLFGMRLAARLHTQSSARDVSIRH